MHLGYDLGAKVSSQYVLGSIGYMYIMFKYYIDIYICLFLCVYIFVYTRIYIYIIYEQRPPASDYFFSPRVFFPDISTDIPLSMAIKIRQRSKCCDQTVAETLSVMHGLFEQGSLR